MLGFTLQLPAMFILEDTENFGTRLFVVNGSYFLSSLCLGVTRKLCQYENETSHSSSDWLCAGEGAGPGTGLGGGPGKQGFRKKDLSVVGEGGGESS